MSMVDELLLELRQRDVTLWLEGDRLRYRAAKDGLTPELLAQLKAQKAEVIAFLRQASNSASLQIPPIQPIERNGHLPLSFAQQRLWFLHQFEPESTSNNMPVVVRFTGSLDVEALEKSIQTVVCRQEVLRTRFPAVDGQPTLVIQDQVNITLPLIDLRQLPEEERDTQALKLATQEARQPFDLANGPILRVKLLRLRDDEHLFIWNLHCIVCDGASSDVFYQDLTAIYKSIVTKNPSPLADLPVQYVDFAHWQRQWLQGEVLESQLKYWKQTLAGDLPLIKLPFDHPRPTGVQTFQGDRRARMLPPDLNESLNHLSQQLGATLFMTLLAAFEVLLYRYSGQDDMLISFASAGRGQVETERLVGFFSNTLMLRTNFQGNPSFRELLNRVKDASLQAYTHQDIPFEKLVEELRPEQNQRRSPLFQVKFALNPPWSKGRGMAPLQLPDLSITSLFGYIYHGKTKYDLTLVMREQDEGLGMVFDYNADIFDGSTIARMIDHFHILLQGIVANPDQRISELPLLTASEQQQLLVQWNKTDAAYPRYASIQEVFEAQVTNTPDAIAVVSGEMTITYSELNQRANQLAHFLQQLGVTTEMPVGICLERSLATLVAILGVLKAGGTYVPLDPHHSIEYLTHILEDAQAPFLLTQQSLAMSLAGVSSKVINLDTENLILQQSQDNPPLTATANTIAFILYTKFVGVRATHRGIVQLVRGNSQWKLAKDTILLHWSSIASEVVPFELFGALLNGGAVVIAPGEVLGKQFNSLIHKYQVNTLWLPTRFVHHLVNNRHLGQLESVKTLLLGGDIPSMACVQKLLKDLPNCTLINTFSLPENVGFTCGYTLKDPVPTNVSQLLGIPSENTQVYVLDEHQQPVPIGVVGELYVAGAGLAKGYHRRPDFTASRFVLNPFNRTPEARMYKTGYLVRYLPDGNLEHVGFTAASNILPETDTYAYHHTVALHQHPAILEAVVVPQEDAHLVAYIVAASSETPNTSELRKFLQLILPGHIIPSAFVQIDSLPLTPDGKINRGALPKPETSDLQSSLTYVAPRTIVEQQLAEIWAEVLKLDQVGIYDNFFELGGHSLLTVRLVTEIEARFGKKIPLSTILISPTISQLAKILTPSPQTTTNQDVIVLLRPGDGASPVFLIHDGDGEILLYRSLARSLKATIPVYGVQPGSKDKLSLPHTGIKDLASYYIKQIRQVQPEGPYFLGGLCLGGVLSFEIALQLQRQGQKVEMVALLDTADVQAPSRSGYVNEQRLSRIETLLKSNAHLTLYERLGNTLKQISRKAINLIAYESRKKAESVRDHILVKLLSYYINKNLPLPKFLQSVSVRTVLIRAKQHYIPQGMFEGNVLLIRATEKSSIFDGTLIDDTPTIELVCDPLLGWGKRVTQEVHVYDVPGGHSSMLQEPCAQIVAEKMQTYIDAIEAPDSSMIDLKSTRSQAA
jgi:aspartate racemase